MKRKAHELIFISQIKRDGSGTEEVSPEYLKCMIDDDFELHSLSLSQKTYIAFNFNAFVVKLKNKC